MLLICFALVANCLIFVSSSEFYIRFQLEVEVDVLATYTKSSSIKTGYIAHNIA